MKVSVAKDQSPQVGDVIEFTSISQPRIALDVRQDIKKIGQEPSAQGNEPLFNGRVAA